MPNRRITDRIRELCAKTLDTSAPDWGATLRSLRAAIQEHTLRLSNLSIAATIAGQIQAERRKPEEKPVPVPRSLPSVFLLHLKKKAGSPNRKSRQAFHPFRDTTFYR